MKKDLNTIVTIYNCNGYCGNVSCNKNSNQKGYCFFSKRDRNNEHNGCLSHIEGNADYPKYRYDYIKEWLSKQENLDLLFKEVV